MNTTSNTTVVATKKSPGRPPVDITWPTSEFTVDSVHQTTGLSEVTISKKIHAAVKGGTLESAGTEKSGHGRPRNKWRRRSSVTAQTV